MGNFSYCVVFFSSVSFFLLTCRFVGVVRLLLGLLLVRKK